MTTEQHTVPRRLRRRSDERVIAGVASGLGDYFNIDPLLIRIALVASLVFGGLGIFLYAAAWLLVPDETSERSALERMLGGSGGTTAAGIIGAVLVLVGAVIVLGIGTAATGSDGFGGLGFAIVVIAIGAFLLRRPANETAAAIDPATGPASVPSQASAIVGDGAPVAATPMASARRQPRPASPLGWFAMGTALVAVGGLALATSASVVEATPGQFFGLGLLVLGLALLVGAWWGHARSLIVIGLLVLPFAWMASLVDVPIGGDWGSHRFSPTTSGEVRDTYHVAGGELILDLTRLDVGGEPVAITAEVAFGELLVLVPEDADVAIDAAVGGGVLRLFDGPSQNGTGLEERQSIGSAEPDLILDLEAGIGAVRVDVRQSEDR